MIFQGFLLSFYLIIFYLKFFYSLWAFFELIHFFNVTELGLSFFA